MAAGRQFTLFTKQGFGVWLAGYVPYGYASRPTNHTPKSLFPPPCPALFAGRGGSQADVFTKPATL